jgi:hypothetical protein
MKRLVVLAITIILGVGICTLAYADVISTSKTITADMSVTSNFGMEIWDAEFVQDLGAVDPPGAGIGTIHLYGTSNGSVPWIIKASSDGLVGALPSPETLDVQISTWDDGISNPQPLTGTTVTDLTLTGSAAAIYTAGAGEYPYWGLVINATFAVPVAETTLEDNYSGTLVLTMTE